MSNLTYRSQPVGTLTIEELIVSQAFLDVVGERIEDNGHAVPDNFKNEQAAVSRELDSRLVDDRQRKRAVVLSRLEALKTTAERKQQLSAELAELDKALGVKPSAKKAGR